MRSLLFVVALLAACAAGCSEQTASEHRVVNLTTAAAARPEANEDGGAAAGAADEAPQPEGDPADGEPAVEQGEGLEVTGRGRLSEEQIEAVVAAAADGTQRCYARETKRDPTLEGQVVARITIARTGRVQSVRVLRSDFPGKTMTRCLMKQVKRWRFPRPAGGAVAVTYPFSFARE